MDIHTLEEATYRAWAALETERYDGWVLRFANGYTGRANSVNPIYPSTLNVDEKIAYCDQWYGERGIKPQFRLNPAMQPPNLDEVLAEKGCERFSDSQVMAVALDQAKLPKDSQAVTIEHEPSQAWLNNFCRLHPTHAAHIDTMQAIFKQIQPTTYFATVLENGEAVAMGLAVHDDTHVGLFDIITREDHRGRGLGKRLVGALLARAKDEGAKIGYLQVAAQNIPALKLYTGIGFQLAYAYWYRR
jgi:ribosomal protein S18 acetylase RimI-like enzyme